MAKARNWQWTLFNYTDEHLQWFRTHAETTFKYLCFQKEICPHTQRPHLQGFLIAKHDSRMSAIKSKLGINHIHLEICKKNAITNIAYCSKSDKGGIPDTFEEFGERPKGQGKRSDLDEAIALVEQGANLNDLADECPSAFVKYSRGLSDLITRKQKPRNFKTEVFWLWGPTGSGKSRYAWEQAPNAYSKDPRTKWWCGYVGQECVILDDFRPNKEISFDYLLRLLDRYPLQVEGKGTHCQFTSKIIYITTTKNPTTFCQDLEWLKEEDLNQLTRRIDHTIEFPIPPVLNMMMNTI